MSLVSSWRHRVKFMGQPQGEDSDIPRGSQQGRAGTVRANESKAVVETRGRQDGLNRDALPVSGQPSDPLKIRCNHGGKEESGELLSCNDYNRVSTTAT